MYAYRPYDRLPASSALAPTFTGMGLVESAESGTYPRHRHHDYEALVPQAGGYRCRLNEIEVSLAPGELLLVKPGDWHEDLLHPGGRHAALWFRLAVAGEAEAAASLPFFAEGVLAEQQVLRLPAGEAEAAVSAMLAEYQVHDAASPGLQQGLLTAFFWRLVRAADPALLAPGLRARSQADAFAARLRALFRRRQGLPLTVGEMARQLGLAERTLAEACRRHLGCSPARAWMTWRLGLARDLLRQGLQVQQVAERLGFANPFHFARAYRRAHGRPPSEEGSAADPPRR